MDADAPKLSPLRRLSASAKATAETMATSSAAAAKSAMQSVAEASGFLAVQAVAVVTGLSDNQRSRVHPMATDVHVTAFPDLPAAMRCLVASCNDNDAAFVMTPPAHVPSDVCGVCHASFGLNRLSYYCGLCGHAYCRADLPTKAHLHRFGAGLKRAKLCATCANVHRNRCDTQDLAWRVERISDLMAGNLRPFMDKSHIDSRRDKAKRVAAGVVAVVKAVPVGLVASSAVASATYTVVGADLIRRVGCAGLLGYVLRQDFAATFATLQSVLGTLETISSKDAAGAIYYTMAANRGRRGREPCAEADDHAECQRVSDAELTNLLRDAPLALHAIYDEDVLGLQRVAKLHGLALLFQSIEASAVHEPGYALLADVTEKRVLLIVRGSQSVQDLLTDLDLGTVSAAAPMHQGIATAAKWLYDQTVGALRALRDAGFDQLTISGHSLGGGVAALLATMVIDDLPYAKAIGFAVPACATRDIADKCSSYVQSVVLRDDMIPRTTVGAIAQLVAELNAEPWQAAATEDLLALKARAKAIWAPRRRHGARHDGDAAAPPGGSAMPMPTIETDKLGDNNELFVPGQIVHLYHTHGVYDAAFVDRDCDALGKIHIFENMLSDHLGRNYLAALRIVRDARKASSPPPAWVCFGTHTRCMCCEAPFTWNSTSQSEAQANRDQHNCRSCGWLVCDGCSEKRKPLPEYGINTPVRVCDKCFYHG
ncbi:hypothetical protein SDRG_15190 [Saprolegnia diclina VS20]|uniref:sn-1-specific diacylglycerol lipase n=1 Tax=Saprolegnia diclina (strain VS20) TaxID=1156394 RepID=T0Q0W6_SAPDV|nr:hypothetical protein SDRG_15190 [Saprolegnia diclina VS20]EQC26975.1 hypothetical protein SDRG_15190 [Saprolegnia diclina VS20]|eukprot:XP_008619577.1 hypothetical protein SDRG_15190 [Saprolegnia diclina VS20]